MENSQSLTSQAIALLFSQTSKNIFIRLTGITGKGIFVLIFSIVISRILGPSNFGVFSTLLAFYIFLYDFFCFGLDQGLIRFASLNFGRGKKKKAFSYIKLVWKIRILTAFFLILISFFIARPFSNLLFKTDHYIFLVKITLWGVASTVLASWVSCVFLSKQEFFKVTFLDLFNGFLRISFLFLFILLKQVTLRSVSLAFFLIFWLEFPLGWILTDKKFLKLSWNQEIFNNLWRFSKWIFISIALASFHSRLDVFMLSNLKGSFETGIYSAPQRLTMGFLWINSALASVFTPKISRFETQPEIVNFFKKQTIFILFLSFPILLLIFFSQPVILLLFGEAYVYSIPILKVLMLSMIFFTASNLTVPLLNALGKSKLLATISFFQLLIVYFGNLFAIKRFGGIGAAWVVFFSNLFLLLISLFYIWKMYRKGELLIREVIT